TTAGARCAARRDARLARLVVADAEHPHGPWDVLQALGAESLEGQVRVCAHLLTDQRGHTDPARVGQRLHAGCDVQTVAIRPRAVVHHVPEVDADAKAHLARWWHRGIALSHRALDGNGALHRLLDAPELCENAVPGGILNASAMGFDHRQNHGLMSLEGCDGGDLVFGHQAAIPGDIRHQDGGEPALNVCLVHMVPRPKTDFSIVAMV